MYVDGRWVHNIGIPKVWSELTEAQQVTIKQVVGSTQVTDVTPNTCPCKLHCRAVKCTLDDLLLLGGIVIEAVVQEGEGLREEVQ